MFFGSGGPLARQLLLKWMSVMILKMARTVVPAAFQRRELKAPPPSYFITKSNSLKVPLQYQEGQN